MDKLSENKAVSRIYDSYDDRLMAELPREDTVCEYDVSFIGTFESRRFECLKHLSEHGIKVDIFGNGWPKHIDNPNLRFHPPVFGPDFRTAVLKSRINLLFLRHQNFDEVTSRSFEIPAFGAFFLAEKSSVHEKLYKSQKILFSDHTELLKRVRHWLTQDEKVRSAIIAKLSSSIAAPHNSISAQVEQILKTSEKLP
jgi:hypothetical protein